MFAAKFLRARNRISFRRRAMTRIPARWRKPFATLQRAQQASPDRNAATFFLRGGTYYLHRAAGVHRAGFWHASTRRWLSKKLSEDEKPVISGGVRLENLNWRPYTNGIFQAQVPDDLQTEEIFVNGERQILARYPELRFQGAILQWFHLPRGHLQGAASPPAGQIRPEATARHAPGPVGRFHVADYRKRHERRFNHGGRLAEQSRRGGINEQGIQLCGKYL